MWKVIDESDGEYEASPDGEIRNAKTKHILKQFKGKDGYMRTQIAGKINKTVLVHRIIAMTFIEPIEGKEFVNHKDGNKSNNSVENLEWVNRSENIKHAYENKLITRPTGTKNPRNKLSLEQVEFIKNNYKPRDKEFGAKALGEKFKVSPKTICAVFHGQNWGDKDDM